MWEDGGHDQDDRLRRLCPGRKPHSRGTAEVAHTYTFYVPAVLTSLRSAWLLSHFDRLLFRSYQPGVLERHLILTPLGSPGFLTPCFFF